MSILHLPDYEKAIGCVVPAADRVNLDVVAPNKRWSVDDLFLGSPGHCTARQFEATGVVKIEVGIEVARRTAECDSDFGIGR